MALALLVEGLVVLLLLSFTVTLPERREETTLSVFGVAPEPDRNPPSPEPEPTPEQAQPEDSAPAEPQPEQPPTVPRPAPSAEPAPAPPRLDPLPAPVIPMTRDQMASADINRRPAPRRSNRPVAGPADPGPPAGGAFADTPRVAGAGPNGEPLYAAEWYREPTEDELRGYLSTASGPGWAMMACRTVQGYRVEDCVFIDEYPRGSNIGRAILAAAWQMRVRPPRLGGTLRWGEWVRIRITYD